MLTSNTQKPNKPFNESSCDYSWNFSGKVFNQLFC